MTKSMNISYGSRGDRMENNYKCGEYGNSSCYPTNYYLNPYMYDDYNGTEQQQNYNHQQNSQEPNIKKHKVVNTEDEQPSATSCEYKHNTLVLNKKTKPYSAISENDNEYDNNHKLNDVHGRCLEWEPGAPKKLSSWRNTETYRYFPNVTGRQTKDFYNATPRNVTEGKPLNIALQKTAMCENQRLRSILRNLGRVVEQYAQEQFSKKRNQHSWMLPMNEINKLYKNDSKYTVILSNGYTYYCHPLHTNDDEEFLNETGPQGSGQNSDILYLIDQRKKLEREKKRLQRRLCFHLEETGYDAKNRGFDKLNQYII